MLIFCTSLVQCHYYCWVDTIVIEEDRQRREGGLNFGSPVRVYFEIPIFRTANLIIFWIIRLVAGISRLQNGDDRRSREEEEEEEEVVLRLKFGGSPTPALGSPRVRGRGQGSPPHPHSAALRLQSPAHSQVIFIHRAKRGSSVIYIPQRPTYPSSLQVSLLLGLNLWARSISLIIFGASFCFCQEKSVSSTSCKNLSDVFLPCSKL